jgi:hypothetical protein
MSSDRDHGGFRLLYPSDDPHVGGHATLTYVVDHGRKGGYEYTLVTASLSKRVSMKTFLADIEDRSQGVDPPDPWAEAAWSAWKQGGPDAVQQVLRQIEARPEDTREGEVRHG